MSTPKGWRLGHQDGKAHQCNQYRAARLVDQNKELKLDDEFSVISISAWWLDVFVEIIEKAIKEDCDIKYAILNEIGTFQEGLKQ